jgi:CelD/BcsL family acetyltransferase involved in cellulose biosynthesis
VNTPTTIVVVAPHDRRWSTFAESHPHGTIFHHPGWLQVIADAYGYRPFVVALEDDSKRVRAGLPFVEVRSPLGRRRWISLPFTDYCAPLSSDRVSLARLLDALPALRETTGVRSIEIRDEARSAGFAPVAAGVRHVLRLDTDEERLLRGFHRSQVQRGIVRAAREGIVVRRGQDRHDLIETFYRLHADTRRRLGVPVQGRRWFELIWDRLLENGLGFVLVASHGGVDVAAALFLTWNGTTVYKYGASDSRYWKHRPNHALFWDAIRWSAARGYHTFDFGRTAPDQQTLAAFKRAWAARETPLEYGVAPGGATSNARGIVGRLAAPVIRRSPVWVARYIGEIAYRYAA